MSLIMTWLIESEVASVLSHTEQLLIELTSFPGTSKDIPPRQTSERDPIILTFLHKTVRVEINARHIVLEVRTNPISLLRAIQNSVPSQQRDVLQASRLEGKLSPSPQTQAQSPATQRQDQVRRR